MIPTRAIDAIRGEEYPRHRRCDAFRRGLRLSLGPSESRQFVDLESGARRVVNPELVRERYLQRFRAFMEEHEKLFQSLEMPHCVVRTDESPWQALAMFLAERERLK